MTTSKAGINFIKQFEGLRLEAYKATPKERYYTIGYGHYGSDVRAGQKITEKEAEKLLQHDLFIYENAVNELPYNFTQNAFDAMVDFCYNCGPGNLLQLTDNGKRTITQIAEKLPLYCKASGTYMEGLRRRREAEKKLFLTPDQTGNNIKDLQEFLNAHGSSLAVDGIAGPKTIAALRAFLACSGVTI